ncbi:uncharacterized protein isoform X1 [Danio rerio]|uniref:Uncharacterized protein isoform X1 n=1 Tax=Danio rerio TaxID=7955 RepID=A0AC58G123_DANRE
MRFVCVLWLWTFISEFKTSTTDEVSTQGYKGRNITITCSHKWASDNIKYFCRDPCKDTTEVLVKSDQSPKGRYTLKDTGDVFTVTITNLQESDSGVYWCGVERVGLDTYNKVTLTVSEDNTWVPEEVIHVRTTEPQISLQTRAEIHSTTPRLSVSESSTTKTIALFLTSTGFANATGPDDILTVPVLYIIYGGAGLVIMVIICTTGLITVCQCRKRIKRSRSSTARSIYNGSEEASGVYENAPEDRAYACVKKSSDISKKKRQSDPIYQNIHFDTSHKDAIYGNVY